MEVALLNERVMFQRNEAVVDGVCKWCFYVVYGLERDF